MSRKYDGKTEVGGSGAAPLDGIAAVLELRKIV